MKHTLNESEMAAIKAALSLAAEKYRDCANTMRSQGYERIAAQFDTQAAEASVLWETIDSADKVVIE